MFKKVLFLSMIVMFLFSCGKKKEEIIKKPETPGISKPEIQKLSWKGTGPNQRFYKVEKKLDRDGDFYLYMDIKDAFRITIQEILSVSKAPGTPDEFKMFFTALKDNLDKLGLFGLEDFGMSGIQIDEQYQYKTYFRANDTKTLLFKMLGGTPHTSFALKYAPDDVIFFHAMDLDLSQLMSFVKSLTQGDKPVIQPQDYNDTTKKIQDEFGIFIDELISSLETEFAIILRMDPKQTIKIPETLFEIQQPQFALFIPTKKQNLHNAITQLLQKNNITMNTTQKEGIIRTLVSIPPIQVFPMNPELTFNGEYEIICSHQSFIDEILKAIKSGQGLSVSPEFQNLKKNLPQKYNGMTFISAKLGEQIVNQLTNALNTEQIKGIVNTQSLSDFLKIFLGARLSVRINEPEGIWIVARQFVGKDSATLPGVASAALMSLNSGGGLSAVMVLSAIAIPNFLEAQIRSKVSRTKADMRSLTTAIESYKVDYNTYPSPDMNKLLEAPHTLTTPIAYITRIPEDPFAPEKGGKIRYYMKDNVFILYAAGPDEKIDIDPEVDFDPQNPEKLKNKTYDPSNGTVSSGDIVRISNWF